MAQNGHFGNYFTQRKLVIALLFAVFLFLRLFIGDDTILFGADNLKYIEAAKTFPYHTLYNNQLYLLHPPLYPYAIYFLSFLFQEYYIGAIAISLLSSIVTFFILYKLFMLVTRNFTIAFFVLLFYALSVPLAIASNAVLKESFVLMLIFSTLYFFAKAIKNKDKVALLFCTLFGIILALSSDHVIFIFPALALSYLIFNNENISLKKFKFPNAAFIFIPIVLILLAYGSWLFIKYYQYSSNEYYPNGLEGTPLSTKDLNLLKAISPTNFEDFNAPLINKGATAFAKKLAFNFGYMFNIHPFGIPLGLNLTTYKFLLKPHHAAFIALIYLPLAIAAFFGFGHAIFDSVSDKKLLNNTNLYFLGLFLIFLAPLSQSISSPRFIYSAYIFFFYFISYGIYLLFFREKRDNLKFIFALAVVLLLLAPYWYYNNPYFAFYAKKDVATENTANFINANIGKNAGLMVQPGYGVELIHLTGRRAVGLYPKPEKLIELIDYFRIDYIVFGKYYTEVSYHYSVNTVSFIKNNPDKFELVATIKEDYSSFYDKDDPARADEVYIYRVKRAKST